MHLNFCTLFDSNYLNSGLALYYSLERNTEDYTLFIIAMDQMCYSVLEKLSLNNVVLLKEEYLLTEHMLQIKKERLRSEYCWTCSSVGLHYVIERFSLDNCTYLDSDIYFFGDSHLLVNEMIENNKSILITKHRFRPTLENLIIEKLYGKYCVQFNTFLNNQEGMKALGWWKAKCIERCSITGENGTYGDQKYLDKWTKIFSGVHELKHLGGGVAPWNINQYQLAESTDAPILYHKATKTKVPLVFYHFQSFRLIDEETADIGVHKWQGKNIDKKLVEFLYQQYINKIKKIDKMLADNLGYAKATQQQLIEVEKAKEYKRKKIKFFRALMVQVPPLLSAIRYKLYRKKDIINLKK